MSRSILMILGVATFTSLARAQDVSFPHRKYSFSVPENSPVSTVVGQVKPSGNVADLRILGPDAFTIEMPTGNIRTARALNYEARPQYIMLVEASNAAVTSTTTVTVDVVDVNNPPQFYPDKYLINNVRAQLTPGTVILTVRAMDVDMGRNGQLQYWIPGNSPYFAINKLTGQISVVKPIPDSSVTFSVVVWDSGTPPLSATATVRVNVRAGPMPTETPRPLAANTSFDAVVLENAAIGTNLLDLQSVLPCSPSSSYTITPASAANRFSISAINSLLVSGHLDFETQPFYDLTISALPTSECSAVSPVNVRVTVLDVNDFPPMFVGVLSPFRVPANLPVGRVIYTMYAWDGDQPNTANSRVEYGLESGRTDVFSVDSSTGQLSIKSPLVSGTTYRLRFRATDGGHPKLSGFTDTEIEAFIPDVGQPGFGTGFKVVTLTENSPVGTVVDKVSATTRQAATEVFYRIIGSTAQQQFTIDANSGVIKTMRMFDRETTERTALVVRATNKADLSLNSDVMINVVITDVNDNKPTFPFRSSSASVPHDALNGTVVFRTRAVDADIASQMSYAIAGGNDQGVFDIANTNNIVLTKSLAEVTDKAFTLNLTVSDGIYKDYTQLIIHVLG